MKKILFVITKPTLGGAQRYVYDLATHLPSSFESVLVTGIPGPLTEKLGAKNIQTILVPKLGRDVALFSDLITLWNLFCIFRREKPDIVHLNSSKAGLVGSIAARLARVPRIIFTAHGWPFNEARAFPIRLLFFILSWLTVLLSHRTIAVSNNVAQTMVRAPGVRKKIEVIHLGIESSKLLPPMQAKEMLLGPRAQKFIDAPWLGTIAELHKNKGIRYAIEALTRLKHIPWVYIVVGEGEERNTLEKIIREGGLTDRVFLVGARSHAAKLMSAFDFFVLPSATEALSYVLLEAGVAELPVIASNVGGIPEVIANEKTGVLVPPKNPAAFARAIDKAILGKLPLELGANLHAHVAEKFDFKTFIEKTRALYE